MARGILDGNYIQQVRNYLRLRLDVAFNSQDRLVHQTGLANSSYAGLLWSPKVTTIPAPGRAKRKEGQLLKIDRRSLCISLDRRDNHVWFLWLDSELFPTGGCRRLPCGDWRKTMLPFGLSFSSPHTNPPAHARSCPTRSSP